MEALTAEIASAGGRVGRRRPLCAAIPAGFQAATARLAAAQAELADAEERWLELEMRREAVEQARR